MEKTKLIKIDLDFFGKMSNVQDQYATMKCYVTYERFILYAKSKGYERNEADELFAIFASGLNANFRNYQYEKFDIKRVKNAHRFPEAFNLAVDVYDNICNTVDMSRKTDYHYDEEKKDIRKYFYENEKGEFEEFVIDLSFSSDIISLSEIIKNRTDLYYRGCAEYADDIEIKDGLGRKRINVFDGDIFFVHNNIYDSMFSLYKLKENAGVYVYLKGCYRKLLYKQGTGYVDEKGNLNLSEGKYTHYAITGIADAQYFEIVGNTHKTKSILKDYEDEELEDVDEDEIDENNED